MATSKTKTTSAPGPSVGSVVLYALATGVSRPAIVVEDFGNGKATVSEGGGACNLRIFVDGENDEPLLSEDERHGEVRRTSVVYDPAASAGTWHWPDDANIVA